jgi:hypothetical protein
MTVETAKDVLLWCAIINYGLVLAWLLSLAFARERLYRLWGRWFRLSAEQFDALSFIGIAVYKVGILLFNVVPYIALVIAG